MPGHVDHSVVISAPLDTVWEIMNDIENWTNLYTEYEKVEILERQGNTIVFRFVTHPDKDGAVWRWTSERTIDPEQHTVHSHRIETGPFEYMNIYWEFEPVDGGTKMRWVQDFHTKPGAPRNDDQAAEYISGNTRTQMHVIKERIESRVTAH